MQVQQLKEMVILPLLYPALMAHMHITPPRHVLLCLSLTGIITLAGRLLCHACSPVVSRVV